MPRQRSFQSALKEAVETARYLRDAESVHSRKLTPHAFTVEALRLAGVPNDELASLPSDVTDFPGPAATHPVFDKLATLQRAFTDGRVKVAEGAIKRIKRAYADEDGFRYTRPIARVGGYIGPAETELFALGVPPLVLAVEAVRQLALERPEVFGTCDDADGHEATMLEKKAKFENLCNQLETTWTGDDVISSNDRLSSDEQRRGLTRLAFRVAPEITVVPGCGRRLVEVFLDRDDDKEAKVA